MNEEVRRSRLRVSRRRALSIGGTVGLAGLLAACGGTGTTPSGTTRTTTVPEGSADPQDVLALLDQAGTCTPAVEQTAGPYWFDVDSVRADIRENRPGTPLQLAVRVQDVSRCSAGGDTAPVPDAVVEIWHCDAGGVYSGFESASAGDGAGQPPPGNAGPPGGPGGGSASETSNGSYSVGEAEAATSDDGTYLRGAQVTDASGIARFTTIYPGWYRGRTTHVHCKVHLDKRTVLTTQFFADDTVNDEVYRAAPYDEHTGRDTTNATDGIYDETGLLTIRRVRDGYLGVINVGIRA